jgi:hypothetical protein
VYPFAWEELPIDASAAQSDVPEAKADLVHAIYEKVVEKVVVAGRNFVSARLTPAAYQHGLALALPEAVMARPAVSEFRT